MSRRSLYEISEDLALVEQALVDTSDPDGIASLERYLAELAVERKRLADERDRLAGGMAQAESPELEPEDGRRRGPRR